MRKEIQHTFIIDPNRRGVTQEQDIPCKRREFLGPIRLREWVNRYHIL